MIRFLLMFSLMIVPAFAADVTLEQAKQDMNAARYANAIQTLQKLVGIEEDNYEAWFLFGVAQVHEQKDHQAIEAFRHVIELRPALAEPHNNLAAVYNNLGDTKAAIKELDIALEKRPNYAIAEENLADLHIKLALKHYRSSLNHDPNPNVEKRYSRLLKVRSPSVNNEVPIETKPEVQQSIPKVTSILAPVSVPVISQAKAFSSEAGVPQPVSSIAEDMSISGVLDALDTWRKAWSEQDLDTYFSSYRGDYKPDSRFGSNDAWKAYKTRVINNKTFIKIQFEEVEIDIPASRDMATVSMLQHFRSNTYFGDDRKQITMEYTPQGWKIITEVTLR